MSSLPPEDGEGLRDELAEARGERAEAGREVGEVGEEGGERASPNSQKDVNTAFSCSR